MSSVYAGIAAATGVLHDIRYGPQQPGGVWPNGDLDVPLVAMPTGPVGTRYTATGPDASGNYTPVVANRVPRTIAAIATDVFTLAATDPTDWAAILANFFPASPGQPLYFTDLGTLQPLWAMQDAQNRNPSTGALVLTTYQQKVWVAVWCLEHPTYLVNPSFAPTVNIPGDQPAS